MTQFRFRGKEYRVNTRRKERRAVLPCGTVVEIKGEGLSQLIAVVENPTLNKKTLPSAEIL